MGKGKLNTVVFVKCITYQCFSVSPIKEIQEKETFFFILFHCLFEKSSL